MKKTTFTCDRCGKALISESYNYPLSIGHDISLMSCGTAPYPHPRMNRDLCEDCASEIIVTLNLFIKEK